MAKIRIEVEPEQLIVITENHGGYLGARCALCCASGWLEGKLGYRFGATGTMNNLLIHKRGCKVGRQAMTSRSK